MWRAVVGGVALVALTLTSCSEQQGSTKDFCAQVKKVPAIESVLNRFTESDPAVLKERIEKASSAYQALVDSAPSEISDDVKILVAVVDETLDAAADNPDDQIAAANQLRKAMTKHPDAEKARASVATFAEKNCGIRLDPSLTKPGD
ncbi:MAG: hypothetical protein KDA95_02590 [Acidimicrobiales bacterium]|nr:hypothetical protein [Acidimicrobiales bacterium]